HKILHLAHVIITSFPNMVLKLIYFSLSLGASKCAYGRFAIKLVSLLIHNKNNLLIVAYTWSGQVRVNACYLDDQHNLDDLMAIRSLWFTPIDQSQYILHLFNT
ncbi:hypothetical protein ACJX0J_007335, partial [Zea mays]